MSGYTEALAELRKMQVGTWQALGGSELVHYLATRSFEGTITEGEQHAILGLNTSQKDALTHAIRQLEREAERDDR